MLIIKKINQLGGINRDEQIELCLNHFNLTFNYLLQFCVYFIAITLS